MSQVASRELRNHTAAVLDRVAQGERIELTVHGEVVAEISAVTSRRPAYFRKAELLSVLASRSADPGLRDDLARLAGETTDELDLPLDPESRE